MIGVAVSGASLIISGIGRGMNPPVVLDSLFQSDIGFIKGFFDVADLCQDVVVHGDLGHAMVRCMAIPDCSS